MSNPAEDIVRLWLQLCKKRFTMQNIYLKSQKPGRGIEVDFLSTRDGEYFWTEVSVSPNPVKSPKIDRASREAKWAARKFDKSRVDALSSQFQNCEFKWETVYSSKLFDQGTDQESTFLEILRQEKIEGISFDRILDDLLSDLKFLGYDYTSNFVYLIKKFLVEKG